MCCTPLQTVWLVVLFFILVGLYHDRYASKKPRWPLWIRLCYAPTFKTLCLTCGSTWTSMADISGTISVLFSTSLFLCYVTKRHPLRSGLRTAPVMSSVMYFFTMASIISLDPLVLDHRWSEPAHGLLKQPGSSVSLPLNMLSTPDAALMHILPWLNANERLHDRHKLHGLAYCEVEQILTLLQPGGIVNQTSLQRFPHRLPKPETFCNTRRKGYTSRSGQSPKVQNEYITDLLYLRSELAQALLAYEHSVMPLLERTSDAVFSFYGSTRRTAAEHVSWVDNAFASPCPSRDNSGYIHFTWQPIASNYCYYVRRQFYPTPAFNLLKRLFGTQEVSNIRQKAAVLRLRLSTAGNELPSAVSASITLPEHWRTTVERLPKLSEPMPLDDRGPIWNKAYNHAQRIELSQMSLGQDDAMAINQGIQNLQNLTRDMLDVSPYIDSRKPWQSLNLSSLSLEYLELSSRNYTEDKHNVKQVGHLVLASTIYDVWFDRGQPVYDITKGWNSGDWVPYEKRLEEGLESVKERNKKRLIVPSA